ncbi:MAG TPA: hypothetical protein GX391_03500 [Firmicutes bacterium]|nr:hypothetical protein [Bacillota bacterium]
MAVKLAGGRHQTGYFVYWSPELPYGYSSKKENSLLWEGEKQNTGENQVVNCYKHRIQGNSPTGSKFEKQYEATMYIVLNSRIKALNGSIKKLPDNLGVFRE